MAPRYVCTFCGRQLRPKQNGVYGIEMAEFGPYKIWYADLWECPECTQEILAGFGLKCLAEHYEDDFDKVLKRAEAGKNIYFR